MKKYNRITAFIAAAGIFFLILDRQTALHGMQEGMTLCIKTVIPGMFPFFVLTGLLNASMSGSSGRELLPIPRPLRIPCFLGGYPMGAKVIGDNYRQGRLQKKTALRLLLFSSNAGPAFFFGILPPFFENKWMVPCLWAIHAGAALLISYAVPESGTQITETKNPDFSKIMQSSVMAMGTVCGWILCFRILTAAADKWLLWRLPQWLQVLLTGLTELTAGCSRLNAVESLGLRFILAAGMLGFGGLCVAMQTASVLGDLPMHTYCAGKLLHGLISMVLAASAVRGLWPVTVLLLAGAAFLMHQNRTGKIPAYGV